MKTKRLISFLLCLLTIVGVMPFGTALAAESTVTIESQTNSAFDYLEYYKDGKWQDLNMPRHWIESTGLVCYCMFVKYFLISVDILIFMEYFIN